MRDFLIFRGDLISRIGVQIKIFLKGQNIEIKLFFQVIRGCFGIGRGDMYYNYQELNLNFHGAELNFHSLFGKKAEEKFGISLTFFLVDITIFSDLPPGQGDFWPPGQSKFTPSDKANFDDFLLPPCTIFFWNSPLV